MVLKKMLCDKYCNKHLISKCLDCQKNHFDFFDRFFSGLDSIFCIDERKKMFEGMLSEYYTDEIHLHKLI
jgi:hypothetical protein